jgi:hypothetical protein
MRPVIADQLVLADHIRGDDDEDTALLQRMRADALAYIGSFAWCRSVIEMRMGYGIGKIVALFLIKIDSAPRVDEWLWVVVGDLPSAYFVLDNAPDPAAALKVYCNLMTDWITAVRTGSPLDHVFPVQAPADDNHAAQLDSRVRFLRNSVLPRMTPGGSDP